MTTKKRASGTGATPAKRPTTKRTGSAGAAARGTTPKPAARPDAKRAGTTGGRPQPAGSAGGRPQAPARRPAQPRIRASHGSVPDAPSSSGGRPLKALSVDTGAPRRTLKPRTPGAAVRKAPLTGPKRAVPRPAPAADAAPGPSSEARELAVALAAAGIEKKAIGIEILDVTGKVDYADFLVVMTGRSDRHVHSIATGIEEEMRKRKHPPLSMEGLTAANWVLLDFGDVVVHVFQEEARALYDIEGLWIDAGRVPVPAHEGAGTELAPSTPVRPYPGD